MLPLGNQDISGPVICSLFISGLRNLKDLHLEFSPALNCFYGENGQGKTNLLEALYLLCQGRSFRKNARFSEWLSMDEDHSCIQWKSTWEHQKNNIQNQFSYSGDWSAHGPRWFFNQTLVKNQAPTAAVFINPFDSYSFHTSRSFRRQKIGLLLETLDPNYKKLRQTYERAIRQRNNLLAYRQSDYRKQIEALDDPLSEIIFRIKIAKESFLQELAEELKHAFALIFAEHHSLELRLEGHYLGMNVSQIRETLAKDLVKDLEFRRTAHGPHLDDFLFLYDGLNSYNFCSLGQQKTSYLALIFSFIELYKRIRNKAPLVLIDDISGELDGRRWKNLIDYIGHKRFQVMITTANQSFQRELSSLSNAKTVANPVARNFLAHSGQIWPVESGYSADNQQKAIHGRENSIDL